MNMGTFRLLLAIIVILSHTNFYNINFIGGKGAVELFFIISGFYMSLILNEKLFIKGDYKKFIINRGIRIFPMFLVVVFIIFSVSILSGLILNDWINLTYFKEYFNTLNTYSLFYLILTNISIFGQDIVMFLGLNLNGGYLFFTKNFLLESPMLHNFLLIPQGWSISLELMFYLIAPFIVRRKFHIILLIIFISICLRYYIYFGLGLLNDPWTYRFFPTELALFLFGTISYKLYSNIKSSSQYLYLGKYISIIFIILILSSDFITLSGEFIHIRNWIIYLTSIIVIPYLFIKSQNNEYDKKIGDLSYPIFLVHYFIIVILEKIAFFQSFPFMIFIITLLSSIIISILLIKHIQTPINKYKRLS